MKRYTAVKSIITAAIPLIEQGWTKGVTKDLNEDGSYSYCAMGALYAVSRNIHFGARAMRVVERTNCIMLLAVWNDEPQRRKRDVISAFKKTLKSLEKA